MNRLEIDRIDWDTYFLSLAKLASIRSHDAETKHGCVLVNNKRVVSMGYNGYPRDIPEEYEKNLPNLRPDKYPWMLHSERNAISHATLNGISLKNCTAYITGLPCNDCLMAMWQSGIVKIVCIKGYKLLNNNIYNTDDKIRQEFIKYTGISLEEKEVDFSFISELFNV